MRKRQRMLALALSGVLAFGCLPGTVYPVNAATTVSQTNNVHNGTKPADGNTDGVEAGQPFPTMLFSGGEYTDYTKFTRFRIPSLTTTADGTLVAASDLRWDECGDGGGIDTIVSRTTDAVGTSWNYTVANYLGDNGNKKSRYSTAFIDTALAAVPGTNTVYMACDLYPSGISLNNAADRDGGVTQYLAKNGNTGFDSSGRLLLAKASESVTAASDSTQRAAATYGFYLEKIENADADNDQSVYKIVDASTNTEVSGYTVDGFFNIKNTDGTIDTNLFCGDSPYYPYPTNYVYVTKSENSGATWSAPMLAANTKKVNENTFLVCPGRGVVMDTAEGQKKLIFACYDYGEGNSSRDGQSCTISLDLDTNGNPKEGSSWERGTAAAKEINKSSEAAITAVGNKLYMFVRHENVYYISDDYGKTWSDAYETGISYWKNCEISAITYSKEINGMPAIVFSAPSSTSGRQNGKVWIALVQDNGKLKWIGEKEINGAGDHYAYSCLTEMQDGNIGLLYESASEVIKFMTIDLKDDGTGNGLLENGAEYQEIYAVDDAENELETVQLKPGESASYKVYGITDESVIVNSSNAAVSATYADGKLTVSASADITGLEEAVITLNNHSSSMQITVDVTATKAYQKVVVGLGESETIIDKTGAYVVDESGSDIVGITSEINENVTTAHVETGLGEYKSTGVDLSLCEYKFEGGTSGVIRAVNPTSVWVQPGRAGNIPNQTSGTANKITVSEGTTANTFRFQNQTKIDNKNYYLAFANKSFDRDGTYNSTNDDFELYIRTNESTQNAAIGHYKRVTELSEITAGSSYLIVAYRDGVRYCLSPSSNNTRYGNLARLESVLEEPKASVSTARGTFSTTSKKSLSNCLYTFSANGNYWNISAEVDGSTVYLYANATTTSDKIPNHAAASASGVEISTVENASTYKIGTVNGRARRYMYLYRSGNSKYNYDAGNNANSDGYYFYILETGNETESSAVIIPGYKRASTIQNGHQYLIVADMGDGEYCIVTPHSNSSNYYDHITKASTNGDMNTKLTFTGKKKGTSSVTIGNTTYYITVKGEEVSSEDVALKLTAPVKGQPLGAAVKNDEKDTYTIKSTVWTDSDGKITDTASENSNYLAMIELAPTDTTEFTAKSIPTEITINIDGTHTKTVPITYADLNSDGTMMVSYAFEDLFIGGGLRMDYATDYSRTCMRFGYDFKLPTGATFEGCEWYYGTKENALTHTLSPKVTKYIKGPEGKDADTYRSNIVFTNLGSANYVNNVYARVLVKYTVNGKSYSKMGSFVDTRTVKEVAQNIKNSDKSSEKQKIYAEGILDAIAE